MLTFRDSPEKPGPISAVPPELKISRLTTMTAPLIQNDDLGYLLAMQCGFPNSEWAGPRDSGYGSFYANVSKGFINPSFIQNAEGNILYPSVPGSIAPNVFQQDLGLSVGGGGSYPTSVTTIGNIPPYPPVANDPQYCTYLLMSPKQEQTHIHGCASYCQGHEGFDDQHAGYTSRREDREREVTIAGRRASAPVSDADRKGHFECCHHQFNTKSAFTRHRRESCRATERQPKQFLCGHCGKSYTRRCNLKQHLRKLGRSAKEADDAVRERYANGMRRRQTHQGSSHQ